MRNMRKRLKSALKRHLSLRNRTSQLNDLLAAGPQHVASPRMSRTPSVTPITPKPNNGATDSIQGDTNEPIQVKVKVQPPVDLTYIEDFKKWRSASENANGSKAWDPSEVAGGHWERDFILLFIQDMEN
ncbi:hypothetical protein DPSP01_004005 [Paraphaeosphaeria sporulosa]